MVGKYCLLLSIQLCFGGIIRRQDYSPNAKPHFDPNGIGAGQFNPNANNYINGSFVPGSAGSYNGGGSFQPGGQTGNFNPGVMPSGSFSGGSVGASSGGSSSFNPNSFSAGNYDPNNQPSGHFDPSVFG